MIIKNIIIYYLIPKPSKVKYPPTISLLMAFKKGYRRYASTVVDEETKYIDLEPFFSQVTGFCGTLEDFFEDIDIADVTLLDELPRMGNFMKYIDLHYGGYTLVRYKQASNRAYHKEVDLLIAKRGYDMRALADRCLVMLNGLVHKVGASPYGGSALVYDGVDVLTKQNYSAGLLYVDSGTYLYTGEFIHKEVEVVDGNVHLKVKIENGIEDILAGQGDWIIKMIVAGHIQFDLPFTYDPVTQKVTISMDDLDSIDLVKDYGYLLYPAIIDIDQGLSDDNIAELREAIFSHYLTRILILSGKRMDINYATVTNRLCAGKYTSKGNPSYPLVNRKGFMVDYTVDVLTEDETIIMPRIYAIEKRVANPRDTPLDRVGTLDMGFTPHAMRYKAIEIHQ